MWVLRWQSIQSGGSSGPFLTSRDTKTRSIGQVDAATRSALGSGVVVVAVLLMGPILLPAFEMTRYTVRSEFTYQDAVSYSLAPVQARRRPGHAGPIWPGPGAALEPLAAG